MRQIHLISILFLFFYSTHAQEASIWKEYLKEDKGHQISLDLYDDGTYLYQEKIDDNRLKFSLGTWEQVNELIQLFPYDKKDFNLEVLKKEKSEYSGIHVVDHHNKPIPFFDFIQFSQNVSALEAVKDMDEFLHYHGKPSLTEISTPIHGYEEGWVMPDFNDLNDQVLAYDLYQINKKIYVFKLQELKNTVLTVRINLPAEIFMFSSLFEYKNLPSEYIELVDDGFKFISNPN